MIPSGTRGVAGGLAMANNGSGWDTVLELDDAQPTGEVPVGDHGTVPLDLPSFLDR
ncbi:hypothetical protein [Nocardioides sp.]|uniref:hypothetical protein n=1 Tax=Nocardioides sp. TaxID=35761 RepID=UPI0039E6F7F9